MTEKKEKRLLGVIIVLMIIVLLGLCAVLVSGVRRVGRENPTSSLVDFPSVRRARGPLPISDADLVRPWMTFDYINHLFGLSAQYLKSSLNIKDSRYPNLSISEYRESVSTSSASLLNAVKSAISNGTTSNQ